MQDFSDIQVVTVAYNSLDVIGDMLSALPEGVHITIVDNASADRAALHTLAQIHGAKVVRNNMNRGFGVACNIGAADGTSKYLFFSTPMRKPRKDACLDCVRLLSKTQLQAALLRACWMDGGVLHFDAGPDFFRNHSIGLAHCHRQIRKCLC